MPVLVLVCDGDGGWWSDLLENYLVPCSETGRGSGHWRSGPAQSPQHLPQSTAGLSSAETEDNVVRRGEVW